MKFGLAIQHRPFSVIANCEYNEAGSKEKGKRDEADVVWPPPDLLQKRRPSRHSPCFSEIPIIIGLFENAE